MTTTADHITAARAAANAAYDKVYDEYVTSTIDLTPEVAATLYALDGVMRDVTNYGDTTGLDAADVELVVGLGYAEVTDTPVIRRDDGRPVVIGHRMRLTDAGRAYGWDYPLRHAVRRARQIRLAGLLDELDTKLSA